MRRNSLSIDVAAPPELVFQLARDPLRWPALLPHYSRARRIPRSDGVVVAEFVARRPLIRTLGLGLPVAWRSLTWSEPAERRLRFVHRGGATDGMDVTWRIDGRADGCRVSIEHIFPAWPPLYAALVERFFVRPIAGQTLATFKALAEALADASPTPSEPNRGARGG
jgi:ribosome-associated toxin RatA of RatAB toxin-antitoxin module